MSRRLTSPETLQDTAEIAIDAEGALRSLRRKRRRRKDAEPSIEYAGALGKYEIDREIGRGGMGCILRARDRILGRPVAIKLLLSAHRTKPEMRRRFIDEACITGQLQHPGITPIYETGYTSGQRPFFAMKLIEGDTLAAVLRKSGDSQLERSQLLNIFHQVCHTLAYTHSQGIVHLDIKPANVMVGSFGEVLVMDWGLCRMPAENKARQQSLLASEAAALVGPEFEKITGTPAYMAPEQARGRSVDVRTDVFGLGALLFELLTGAPPYQGDSLGEVYRLAQAASLDRAFAKLESCRVDDALVRLVYDCLDPEPKRRPPDAGQVAREISSYLESTLKRAESDLSRFFELSMDLFCIASFDGYFKRVNSNFSRVLGYSDSELVSRPFFDFIHPEDVDETIAVMGDLNIGKPVVQFKNRYRNAGGEYLWFEWTAKSIPSENIIFAVARDVTQRILSEQE